MYRQTTSRSIVVPAQLLALMMAVLALAITSAVGQTQEKSPEAVSTTAQTVSSVQVLLAQYRNPKLDLDRRQQIVEELLDLGQEGARRLAPELARDFTARQKAYPARFAQAAAKVMEKRSKEKNFERDIDRLRKEVLAVSRDTALTKDKIVNQADPARKKLEELLSLSAEQVTESDPTLKRDREMLIQTGAWWRVATEQISASADKPARPAGKSKAPQPPAESFETDLADDEAFTATLASIPDKRDRAVLLSNRQAIKKLDPAEARGILVLNVLRAQVGIGALEIDPKLCAAAQGHSKDMVEKSFFAHESPVPGKSTPWDRAKLAGTTASGENIYAGSPRVEDAIEAWWHSPGHHTNMMGGHHRVGIGRYQSTWTQMFGG